MEDYGIFRRLTDEGFEGAVRRVNAIIGNSSQLRSILHCLLNLNAPDPPSCAPERAFRMISFFFLLSLMWENRSYTALSRREGQGFPFGG